MQKKKKIHLVTVNYLILFEFDIRFYYLMNTIDKTITHYMQMYNVLNMSNYSLFNEKKPRYLVRDVITL